MVCHYIWIEHWTWRCYRVTLHLLLELSYCCSSTASLDEFVHPNGSSYMCFALIFGTYTLSKFLLLFIQQQTLHFKLQSAFEHLTLTIASTAIRYLPKAAFSETWTQTPFWPGIVVSGFLPNLSLLLATAWKKAWTNWVILSSKHESDQPTTSYKNSIGYFSHTVFLKINLYPTGLNFFLF